MKSFLAALVAVAVISLGAWYGLNEFTQWGTGEAAVTRESVRLD